MQKSLTEKDQKVEKLMAKVQASDKLELQRVEKEVKFSIGQLGGKRRRDLKRVGGGIYSTTDRSGNEMLVLVQMMPDPVTKKENTVVVFEDD
jgi:hypothetical protein